MSAFEWATDALFSDPHQASDGLWRPGGTGAPVPVRVIRRAADAEVGWGEARARVPTVVLQLRVADAPELAAQDTVEAFGALYRIQGAPERDAHRLVWTAEAVEVQP